MNNKLLQVLSLFLVSLCISCAHTETKEVALPQEQLVQTYYNALNTNDFDTIKKSISDSITQISGSYTETWSRASFTNWLAWDASFNPKYEIFDIQKIAENEVQITLSKTCERIQFLNEEPTKYVETFHFEDNKVRTIEAGAYLVFNDSLWNAKRDSLVAYTFKNYPELDGFIYDQTKNGATNYLKALRLFKQAH